MFNVINELGGVGHLPQKEIIQTRDCLNNSCSFFSKLATANWLVKYLRTLNA